MNFYGEKYKLPDPCTVFVLGAAWLALGALAMAIAVVGATSLSDGLFKSVLFFLAAFGSAFLAKLGIGSRCEEQVVEERPFAGRSLKRAAERI